MSDKQNALIVEPVERQRIRVELKPENVTKLKRAAAVAGKTMSQFVDEIVGNIEIKG